MSTCLFLHYWLLDNTIQVISDPLCGPAALARTVFLSDAAAVDAGWAAEEGEVAELGADAHTPPNPEPEPEPEPKVQPEPEVTVHSTPCQICRLHTGGIVQGGLCV